LKILDDHLKINTFVVGNKVTIADIHIASHIYLVFRFFFEEKARKTIPNITRWFESLVSQDPFVREFGRHIQCQKCVEWPNVAQPTEEKKKEEKPATKKEEKPAAKKEEKPAPKKEAKEDEGEEQSAEKKEKNPLDLLPPSEFNLFDFKTLFVNAPNKQEALDYFWKNFDANGYSIWFIQYEKAEGEGKVLFLTNNLMNGFIQRLEHFRKYAFGVHGVYGEEPNLEIRGVWVWRGVGIPHEITDLDSYEYHKFTQLHANNENDRKKVNEYWSNLNEDEDSVEGLKVRTCKYFK
jgi:elongation factor 1-gamma